MSLISGRTDQLLVGKTHSVLILILHLFGAQREEEKFILE